MAAVGDGSRWGVEVTYIQQDSPLGLGHCVLISRDFLGDDDFIVYLGDNMIQQGVAKFRERFEEQRRSVAMPTFDGEQRPPEAQILLCPVPDPQRFGVAEVDGDGHVVRLIEKPADPPSNLALAGVYLFTPVIHEAVRSIEPSARGELEITDAIQWLIDHGHRVVHEVLVGWWLDTGKKDPLLESNRRVLETIEPRLDGKIDDESHVDGRVVIEEGAELISSNVRGPAVIGARTRLVNSYVGPFTAVANDCEIVDSEVEHSVVLEHSTIVGVPRLTDSLIGRHVEITRSGQRPAATRVMVGDHCSIDLE
jgi:glucose-1-phosphate thymidylyltransferase